MNPCPRCGAPMIQTEREELEPLSAQVVLVKQVLLDECQWCQTTLKYVFPTLIMHREAH